MKDIAVLFGIIDACKTNYIYKQFLEELKIQQYENNESIVMIKNQIEKDKCGKLSTPIVVPDLYSENVQVRSNDFPYSDDGINSIFLWHITLLSLSSIAFKVGI